MDQAPAIRPERTSPLRAGSGERAGGTIVACLALAVLSLAAWLKPAAAGHGTHTQIGLPPCSWVVWFDKPCPTCGMTTAFTHAGEGQWLASFVTQPAGMVLSVLTATAFWLGAHTALTGSRIGAMTVWLTRPRVLAVLFGGLLAAWVYKIISWNGI